MPATAPMPQVVQGRPSYASAVNVGAPAAVGKPFHHHPHAVHQVHHDVLAASAAQRAWVPVISAPIPRAHSGILMEFRNHRDEGHLGLLEGPVEGYVDVLPFREFTGFFRWADFSCCLLLAPVNVRNFFWLI